MKVASGRSSAIAMAYLAISARLFCGMAVDYPAARNASWMCPLVGLVLCVPLAMVLKRAAATGNGSPWNHLTAACPGIVSHSIAALWVLLIIYDCAAFVRLTAATANFISLNDASLAQLTLPLVLMIAAVILLGSDAEGNSSRIWLRLLPLLFVIVVLVQFRSYNPSWLTPVLGSGVSAVLQGGLLCGGWASLTLLPWIFAVPDRERNHPVRMLLLAALTSSALLIILQMLCPAMIETDLSRMARIEIILNNNRVSHVLQMLMTAIWLVSLLHLISIEAVTAGEIIQSVQPKIPKWAIAIACAGGIFALSLSDWIRSGLQERVYQYLFIAIGLSVALMAGLLLLKNGGEKRRANY